MNPFEQGAFRELPDLPRKPHRYEETAARTIALEVEPFGKHDVHVREMGSGEPLLLIHGLMTTSYSWRYVMAPLAERFHVIAPDLVGCGKSDKPDCLYSARNLARWIGAFQRAMDIRGCAVVGNSLGGYLSRRLALDDREAIRALLDIHSPVFPEVRYSALQIAMSIPGANRLLAKLVARDPLKWAHGNVHYYDESLKSLEEARAYALTTPESVRAFAHYLKDTMAPAGFREMERDLEACNGTFPIPLTLVYARRDPMVKPINGERMSKMFPSAKMIWLEESSHFPQVDSPEKLVEIIRDHIG